MIVFIEKQFFLYSMLACHAHCWAHWASSLMHCLSCLVMLAVKYVELILECTLCLHNSTFINLFLNYDCNMISSLLDANSLSLYKWCFFFSSSSAMMLFKNFNHLRISKKTQLDDMFTSFSCDFCVSHSVNCFVMKSWSKYNKCNVLVT